MIMCMKPYSKSLGLAAVFALSGCASVLDLDDALAIAPYHVEGNGRIVIEARVNGHGPFDFALDTAATVSAIFHELRDELELEPIPGPAVIVHGTVATGGFSLLNVGHLEIGHETWADPRIVSLPGKTAASASIDGLLGVDFLRRYAIGFSTSDRVVRLYPPNLVARRSYRGWASIPLEAKPVREGGAALYFFDVQIDGRKMPAVFDLGAGLNIVNRTGARSLGIVPLRQRHNDQISGVLESLPVAGWFDAEEVTTAGIRWRNERFSIVDLDIFETLLLHDRPAVILGAGLFTQRDFVIDFVRSRLLIRVAMDEVPANNYEGTANHR